LSAVDLIAVYLLSGEYTWERSMRGSLKMKVAPVVQALALSSHVVGVLCFGSYAAGAQDEHSDIDLYVVCAPALLPASERQLLLERISGVVDVQLGHETPGWDNPWSPLSDTMAVASQRFELSYNTAAWLDTVVHKVTADGAISLPEMAFRPYTVTGMLANSIVLYDAQATLAGLVKQLYPYPTALKENLLREFWPILYAELADLHDCAERDIGNAAFIFHLWRACDALVQILFALNERYDPASKRTERELARLTCLPECFLVRYGQMLEGPFTPAGRRASASEFAALAQETAGLGQSVRQAVL
jgi:predicted nucleotidyltransferase